MTKKRNAQPLNEQMKELLQQQQELRDDYSDTAHDEMDEFMETSKAARDALLKTDIEPEQRLKRLKELHAKLACAEAEMQNHGEWADNVVQAIRDMDDFLLNAETEIELALLGVQP
jgi:uncharacterized coiled-coil DUF342 family protein